MVMNFSLIATDRTLSTVITVEQETELHRYNDGAVKMSGKV